jgi:hypothetical protein
VPTSQHCDETYTRPHAIKEPHCPVERSDGEPGNANLRIGETGVP